MRRLLGHFFLAALACSVSAGQPCFGQQPGIRGSGGLMLEKPGSRYDGPAPDPARWPAPTHYIAPNGFDSNSGSSREQAWGTFGHALAQLRPGDVLGVVDGTYTVESTGLLLVDCGGRTEMYSGRANAAITVRAVNERRAILQSDGLTPAVWITGCRNWNVLGLTALGADRLADEDASYQHGTTGMEPVFVLVGVHRSRNVALKRILASRSNRLGRNSNNHLYAIEESSHVIVEESEAYEHHRHAMICWACEYVTFRRNYIHPRNHWVVAPNIGPEPRLHAHDMPVRRFADEAIAFYRGSWGLAENNINEGRNVGYHAHGGETYTANPGGSYNHFLGNIALDNMHASRIDARRAPYAQVRPALNNVFRDFLVVGLDGGVGLWYSTTTNSFAENVTIYGGRGTGFRAGPRGDAPCADVAGYGGCSHELRNALIWDVDGRGMETDGYDRWQVSYSNVFGSTDGDVHPPEPIDDDAGHIRRSISVEPTGMGLGEGECVVFVPPHSNMHGAGAGGADIGARILYRYENGVLTDQPLWDPETGAFSHGAVVEGINDVPGASLFDVHERLNVNHGGCRLPYATPADR